MVRSHLAVPPQRVLFLHANGYPAAVYRRFLEQLAGSFAVESIAIIETAPFTPASLRWRRMREHVLDHLLALPGNPAALVGHSMGGYLALMAAGQRLPIRHPVVLIDSPIPGPGKAALLSLAKSVGLTHRFGPAPIAARRRYHWPDRAAAQAFFAGKPFVQRWAAGVLEDFLAGALRERPADSGGGGVALRIPREEERDIYAHLPHREADRALRRLRAVGTPVGFVAGSRSPEMRMAGWAANRRLFGSRLVTLDTGHLVPMEAPEACAASVCRLLTGRTIGAD